MSKQRKKKLSDVVDEYAKRVLYEKDVNTVPVAPFLVRGFNLKNELLRE